MAAVLDALKIFAHVPGLPGGITVELGDPIPILIVRVDKNQRVMGGASPDRTRPGIKNATALWSELRIFLLSFIAVVVAYKEVPSHRLVLGRKGMKGRNSV